jgi:putative ABC transport system substrate-binding protein
MTSTGLILIAVLVYGLFTAPLAAGAQTGKTYRVALLEPFSTAEARPYREAFINAMRDLGYVGGRNVIFDVRTSDRDTAKVPELLDELLALKPDVLVVNEGIARLARDKAPSIPVVLPIASDPVGAGLAHSLARPGMNVTGVSLFLNELAAKHIGIMRDIRPRLARVGLIFDTTADSFCAVIDEGGREAARSVGAVFVSYRVANREDIKQAFSRMQKEGTDVLLPCPTPLLFNNRDLLFESAVRLRIPFTSFVVENLPLGVLFSYSASFAEGYRGAATYVDRILKGARPGDLPIEQPTRLELVINLKTARAIGLTVPPSVLVRADRVLE